MKIGFFLMGMSLVLGVSACATQAERLNKRVAAIPEEQRSYAIGVYSVDCNVHGSGCAQIFNDIHLNFFDMANPENWSVLSSIQGGIFGGNTEYDFISTGRKEKGYYFCLPLSPAIYSFLTVGYYNFAGGGGGFNLKKEDQFDLRFTLGPAEVVYIGKMRVTTSRGKNLFGMPLPAPGGVVLSSGDDQDLDRALAKCPESARQRQVRTSLLSDSVVKGSRAVRVESPVAGR